MSTWESQLLKGSTFSSSRAPYPACVIQCVINHVPDFNNKLDKKQGNLMCDLFSKCVIPRFRHLHRTVIGQLPVLENNRELHSKAAVSWSMCSWFSKTFHQHTWISSLVKNGMIIALEWNICTLEPVQDDMGRAGRIYCRSQNAELQTAVDNMPAWLSPTHAGSGFPGTVWPLHFPSLHKQHRHVALPYDVQCFAWRLHLKDHALAHTVA